MSTKVFSTQSVSKWLGKWYDALIRRQLNEANQWKKQVDETIMDMEEDQTILIYYSLLSLRHDFLINHSKGKSASIDTIQPAEAKTNLLLTYYYHLFTGMVLVFERDYIKGLQHYIEAENYLKQIPDRIEEAEYHYRVAVAYHEIFQPLSAFKHVNQAKLIFDSDPAYVQKSMDCENLLALCYLTNKDFERAEEHLNRALDMAKLLKDKEMERVIRYNIGFLNSEKGASYEAIRILKNLQVREFLKIKRSFLLAREYFKIGKGEEAFEEMNVGMQMCQEEGNTEYHHHYMILRSFHDGSSDEKIESIVNKAVDYLEEHRLYDYVDDYLSQLANYFLEKENHQKASMYFRKAQDYRENRGRIPETV